MINIYSLVFCSVCGIFFVTSTENEKSTMLSLSRPQIISAVNALSSSWTAGTNLRFDEATVTDLKQMLGTKLANEPGYYAPELVKSDFVYMDADIPKSFDVRTAWPQCSHITGHVRDQSNCGSCWAFASTEAFNDRHCIKTGDTTTFFAVEDTTECCTGLECAFSQGCNGGQPAGAWLWFSQVGVSSGGDSSDLDAGTSCKPYSMSSCAHHTTPPPGTVPCSSLPQYKTPTCSKSCTDKSYGTPYKKDKHRAKSFYRVSGEKNIQKELMEKGTVTVAMTVYEDFEVYSSGVYQHITGNALGGHAIKMIGWGEDESSGGTPYWLCVNSWNELWGEKGTFRILRGSNECGIEAEVVAGEVE